LGRGGQGAKIGAFRDTLPLEKDRGEGIKKG